MAPVPAARRVVSLVPSSTETVCALGAADRLVGRTRYCEEPAAELASVPTVGGTKNPDLERVAALEPDLILVNGEENRREDIAWLEGRFTVLECTPRTVVEAGTAIRQYGRFLGEDEAAHAMMLAIEAQMAAAEVARLGRPPVPVFYPIWRKPWMVGEGTYIHDLLSRAGAHNVSAAGPARYPEVEEAALADLGARIVLLPSEPWEFDEAQRAEFTQSGLFGAAELVLVDGRDYCWHGARTATGLARAVELLSRW